MYAVVGSWTMEAAQAAEQEQVLAEEIVPAVKAAPGFMAAYWCRSADLSEALSFVTFDDRAHAEQFASYVQGDSHRRDENGVALGGEGLRVVEVTTTA
jgi:heme-degrading monooxygenase HmoA